MQSKLPPSRWGSSTPPTLLINSRCTVCQICNSTCKGFRSKIPSSKGSLSKVPPCNLHHSLFPCKALSKTSIRRVFPLSNSRLPFHSTRLFLLLLRCPVFKLLVLRTPLLRSKHYVYLDFLPMLSFYCGPSQYDITLLPDLV